ncbi:nuclease-related domain-containing protein [Thermodesulfovibrio sp. 3907-1M]|uniref:Nuclease-related domain-containing protein n=1 Tax=Thermodesulfovibrio autotrophicus TaxID=3118333 RepID=A0AAU8GY37_9BACT
MREIVLSSFINESLNKLENSSIQKKLIATLVFFVSVLTFFTPITHVGLVGLIVSVLLFVNSQKVNPRKIRLESGAQGENVLKQTLRRILSDSYTAYYGYQTQSNGDVDCIVVGPKGVILIEVKNHKGTILYEERTGWRCVKTGKKGTYEGFIKNPGKQVTKNYWEIRELLSSYGIDIPVYAVVVFTNPKATLEIKSPTFGYKVLKVEDLQSYIDSLPEKVCPKAIDKAKKAFKCES